MFSLTEFKFPKNDSKGETIKVTLENFCKVLKNVRKSFVCKINHNIFLNNKKTNYNRKKYSGVLFQGEHLSFASAVCSFLKIEADE